MSTFRCRSVLPLFCLLSLVIVGCRSDPPWNVLLVTFDTTRADRLGCYGKASARTPTLDRLAAEGVLFERCLTAAPMTMPAHSTIMTGTYPPRHGVRDNGLFALPAASTTLAEILHREGYRTAAAVGSFVLDRRFGLAQGFELYSDQVTDTYEDYRGRRVVPKLGLFFDERPAARVNDAILPWLRENLRHPFFAWVHYWDPHHPHIPPPPYDSIYATDRYQGEIAYADEALGRVIRLLEEEQVLERTLVVMTSDHGEGNDEHGESTHSILCYDTTLRVPLIMRIPGLSGGSRVASQVGTVDILPTILELLGLPSEEDIQGRSLVPEFSRAGGAPSRGVAYYAETLSPSLSHGWGELRVWREGPYKLIHGPRPELFDLDSDPRELQNLVSTSPDVATAMEERLAGFLAQSSGDMAVDAAREMDEETIQRLEALGYLGTGRSEPGSLDETLKTGGSAPQDRVGDLSRLGGAKNALFQGNFLRARELSLPLLAADPENPLYLTLAAGAYMGLGQEQEALRLMERVSTPPKGYARLFYGLAHLLAELGWTEQGLSLVERALAVDGSAAGHGLRADLLGRLQDRAGAVGALRDALGAEESYVPARLELAVVLAQDGEVGQAEEEFLTALRHDPLYPRTHFNYAKFLGDQGRLEGALRHFQRAADLDPRYCNAYLGLIAARIQTGSRTSALKDYDTMVQYCPDSELRTQAEQLLGRQ